MNKNRVEFSLNGKVVKLDNVDPTQSLNDYLRDEAGLTGTKFCCGIGMCRACTVVKRENADATPEPIRSCITPLTALHGASVMTVEGMSTNGELHPLQKSFIENFSFQCGYSTPGFLMAAYCLLAELKKKPIQKSKVETAIQEAVGQHVCRCTGYVKYHAAIKQVILETPGLTLS